MSKGSTKKMKRVICAGLAAQMMLSSVAQAAEPLHEFFGSSMPISGVERAILAAKKVDHEDDYEALKKQAQQLFQGLLNAVNTPEDVTTPETPEAGSDGEEQDQDLSSGDKADPGDISDLMPEDWFRVELDVSNTDKAPENGSGSGSEGDDDSSDLEPGEGSENGSEAGDDGVDTEPEESEKTGDPMPPIAPPGIEVMPVPTEPGAPEDGEDPDEDELVDGEETQPEDELVAEEPPLILMAAAASEGPGKAALNYLLKIGGYGAEYGFDGNVEARYNVESTENFVPEIETDSPAHQYSIKTTVKEVTTVEGTDDSVNIWADFITQNPDYFPGTFVAGEQSTWPVWLKYLTSGHKTSNTYQPTFYGNCYNASRNGTASSIIPSRTGYADDGILWPDLSELPEGFNRLDPQTWPDGSGGTVDVLVPDDYFQWWPGGDGRERGTYLTDLALSTPRVPNKMLIRWHVLKAAGNNYAQSEVKGDIQIVEDYRYENERDSKGNEGSAAYNPEAPTRYVDFDKNDPLEKYTDYMTKPDITNIGGGLALVGEWGPSNNATATSIVLTDVGSQKDISVYAYQDGMQEWKASEFNDETLVVTEKDLAEEGVVKVFARVPYETEHVTFTLYTYEPYSTLTVTATDANGKVITFTEEQIDQESETRVLTNDKWPDNSADNPARGIRSLKQPEDGETTVFIPLKVLTETNRYNTVTMTVTAPDGKTTKVYEVYIQRLAQPEMLLDPGNTPYGMIKREPNWSDEQKTAAKTAFDVGNYFPEGTTNHPTGAINNGGYIYTGTYGKEAWGKWGGEGYVDYDRDDKAIVVYQNATFQLPGFTVTDSLLKDHTVAAAPTTEEPLVTWELTLKRVDTLGPDIAKDAVGGETEIIRSSDHRSAGPAGWVNLHDLAVKPGVYKMTYTFKDPYDETFYLTGDGDYEGHSEENHGFIRTVIVLPLRGDVDMDGEVTVADGVLLRELLASHHFGEGNAQQQANAMQSSDDVTLSLYYFRVCDVTGDKRVNDDDVAALIAGYDTATYGTNPESAGYWMYLPLLNPANDVNKKVRQKAEVSEADAGKTQLVVEYIGVSETVDDAKDGKWNSDPDTKLAYRPNNTDGYPNVFWMGTKLTGAANLTELDGSLTTFTFTLAYDSAYAEPYFPEYGSGTWIDYIKSVNTQWNWNEYTLVTAPQVSTEYGITPVNHDSKALTSLAADSGRLKELRFSLTLNEGAVGINLAALTDYFLKVPFELVAYPRIRMDSEGNAPLVEAALGMRDFTLTTKTNVDRDQGAVWRNQGYEYPQKAAATINLKDRMEYVLNNGVPIGENKGPTAGVLAATYGEDFYEDLSHIKDELGNDVDLNNVVEVVGEDQLTALGLTFNKTTRVLSGVPNRAIAEDTPLTFYVRTQDNVEHMFKLFVNKALLTLTAHETFMYYGETQSGAITFEYDTKDIKNLDKTAGRTFTGDPAELAEYFGASYKTPDFELVTSLDSDGTKVDGATKPGEYLVKISGGETANYTFQYKRMGVETPSPISGSAKLTVHKRPIYVDRITKANSDGLIILGTAAVGVSYTVTGTVTKGEFDASLPGTSGYYSNLPLSGTAIVNGDTLILDYTAEVTDPDSTFSGSSSDQEARVKTIELAESETENQNDYYELLNEGGLTDETAEYWITVTRRKLGSVTVQEAPKTTTFTYGNTLYFDNLTVGLTFIGEDSEDPDDDSNTSQVTAPWTEEGIAKWVTTYPGLTLEWVDDIYGDKVPSGAGQETTPAWVCTVDYGDSGYPVNADKAYAGQFMTVEGKDNMYICLSIPGVVVKDGEEISVTHRVYIGPYTVNKKVLNVTVQNTGRYYGEANSTVVWDLTYNRTELIQKDQDWLVENTDEVFTATGTGDWAELARILASHTDETAYVAPTPEFRKENKLASDVVTQGTDVGDYYIFLTGGNTGGYTLRYTNTDDDDGNGYGRMTIAPRPIVITKITAPVWQLHHNDWLPPVSTEKPHTAQYANAADALREFDVALPDVEDESNAGGETEGKKYYVPGSTSGPQELEIPYELSGSPIYGDDVVTIQYRVGGAKDAFQIDYTTANQPPYWDLKGQKSVEIWVEIFQMALQNNNNYQLVYTSSEAAGGRWTADDKGERVKAHATVSMPVVDKVEVVTAPDTLTYTYGQLLGGTGEEGGPTLYGAITIQITNDDGTIEKPLVYGPATGVYTNSFQDKGLDLYWGDDKDNVDYGKPVTIGERLFVPLHNNKVLYVASSDKSGDIKVPVCSVVVNKKKLTLTPVSQTRIYGEENADYAATFSAGDLVSWDREGQNLGENDTKVPTSVLELFDPTYKGSNLSYDPGATTAKTATVGTYTLGLDLTDVKMNNYELVAASGTIVIDKRELRVTGINKNPVYEVVQGSSVRTIKGIVLYQDNGTHQEMDLAVVGSSTGTAVVAGDTVAVQMDVTFTSTETVTQDAQVTVDPRTFKLVEGSDKNYAIVTNDNTFTSNSGVVRERKVVSASVLTEHGTIATKYTYGDTLDLSRMQLRVNYETEANEDPVFETPFYSQFGDYGIKVYYWDKSTAPTAEEMSAAGFLTGLREAAQGEPVTRIEKEGFTHHGKYLLILIPETKGSGTYIPFVYGLGSPTALTVEQRKLAYTFQPTAEDGTVGRVKDKEYDTDTDTEGYIKLATGGPAYLYGIVGNDDVYVDTTNLHFNFLDANVAVDADGNVVEKWVRVTGVALGGKDAGNYTIGHATVEPNTNYGDIWPMAPKATITKAERPVPDVNITLSVSEHTNIVTVYVDRQAGQLAEDPFKSVSGDYSYEYALVDENGDIIAGWQKRNDFGGEFPLELPGESEGALPRDTWVGALARLAETTNFKVTEATNSYEDDFAAAREAVEDQFPIVPEDETERIIEWPNNEETASSVVKTYTYRIDLIASDEAGGEDGVYIADLPLAWFTDIDKFPTQADLDRLVENVEESLYTAYGWDAALTARLDFPLDLTGEIKVTVTDENGTKEDKVVNEGDILPIYVTAVPQPTPSGGSRGPQKVTIVPDELTLHLDDEPFQLEVIFTPANITDKRVSWRSSDESVVVVSPDGVVTPVGVGTATITVISWNGRTDSITVQVLERKAEYDVPFQDSKFNADYRGSFMGLEGGYFRPEDRLTREEVAVIMDHFFQELEWLQPRDAGFFVDVPEDADGAGQIYHLSSWDIVVGIGEDYYGPELYATRAQFSAILCRMLMLPLSDDPNGPHAFTDAGPEDTWAWAYIDALAEAGIVLGNGVGKFYPNSYISRAEVAAMLSRALITDVDIERDDLIVPLDVTESHWAYRPILRAVNSGDMLMVKEAYLKEASEEGKS